MLCVHIFYKLVTMHTRVLIFTATFDFLAGKNYMFLKYHKNTMCEILVDLNKHSSIENRLVT